ncbi:MAG: hypothetical protein IPJ04_01590 [Candidatus Eisenbacteria bacterium]|nr:hypothetical protein [Candidatus Eisenbacteria bacterium]
MLVAIVLLAFQWRRNVSPSKPRHVPVAPAVNWSAAVLMPIVARRRPLSMRCCERFAYSFAPAHASEPFQTMFSRSSICR